MKVKSVIKKVQKEKAGGSGEGTEQVKSVFYDQFLMIKG